MIANPNIAESLFTPAAEWPAPGVYQNVPFTQYATLLAVNATFLKELAMTTPAKAKYNCEHSKTTPDMEEGHTLHTFILEPERFSQDCHLAEACGAILKSGERKGRPCGCDSAEWTEAGWRCGKHRDGPSLGKGISQSLMTRLNDAYHEIWRVAGDVMQSIRDGDSFTEVALVWEDEGTGLLCKARLDIFTPADKQILDIKKVQSADAEAFGGVAGQRRYDVQAAWYQRAAKACFGDGIYDFRFIAVELNEGEANGAQVLWLDDEAMETGEKGAQAALEVFNECLKSGVWPGYSPAPKAVKLRPWIVRQEEALTA